jgi:molecular chaperone DnaK
MKAKTEALAQASMKIGEAVYKASQAGGAGPDAGAGSAGGAAGGPGPESAAKKDDNVVDADFEEVDEKKKRSK